jgi:hypothetical protein
MGAFLKGSAKVWFYAWDIPALIALFSGHFQIFFAIIGGAGITAGALWLYGDHLETSARPAKIAAWRRSKNLDP